MPSKPHAGAQAKTIEHPFTQSWIQALTLAADNPVARTIKAKLEWVDRLSRSRAEENRLEAAHELWQYAETEGLDSVLRIVPTEQQTWLFARDDIFLYSRAPSATRDTATEDTATEDTAASWSRERWQQALGLQPASFSLTAEVTSIEWMGLVRNEAVRLQQSQSLKPATPGSTLHLPCTAHWDTAAWSIRFEQPAWLVVPYADAVVVPRPKFDELEETLSWAISTASDALVAKPTQRCVFTVQAEPWIECVERLRPLHAIVYQHTNDFSPWFVRVWSCVWPVIYREQNVLRGQADINTVRGEIQVCLSAQPRLTLWMFVFAKLVCQAQLGMGLGICADYSD